MLPTKQKQDLLVSGYCREECIYTLPIVLTKLFLKFYDDIYHWNFSGEELTKFLLQDNSKEIYTSPFFINNISLRLCIYPNGSCPDTEGFVVLFLEKVSFPSNISKIIFHLQTQCIETNTIHRGTHYFDSDCDLFGWFRETLKLSECRHKKELNFDYFIKILNIEYIDINIQKKTFYPQKISMKNKIDFKWNISDKLLNKFRNISSIRDIQYFSNYFDGNCWSLSCAPNDFYSESAGFFVYLNLHQLPYHIKSIDIDYKLSVFYDQKIVERQLKENNVTYGQSVYLHICQLNQIIKDIKILSFKVSVNILAMHDKDNGTVV